MNNLIPRKPIPKLDESLILIAENILQPARAPMIMVDPQYDTGGKYGEPPPGRFLGLDPGKTQQSQGKLAGWH